MHVVNDSERPVREQMRDRAIELAKSQANDKEIHSSLLMEFCAPGTSKGGPMQPSRLLQLMDLWRDNKVLSHARAWGRVGAQAALQQVASNDKESGQARTLAATRLLARVDAVDKLGADLVKERRAIQDMAEGEVLELLVELAENMGGRAALAKMLLEAQ